jgi:hypothetical protein
MCFVENKSFYTACLKMRGILFAQFNKINFWNGAVSVFWFGIPARYGEIKSVNILPNLLVRVKVTPQHLIKTQKESTGIPPPILNLGARRMRVVKPTTRPLYVRGTTLVPIKWEAMWALRDGLEECKERQIFCPPPVFEQRTVQLIASRHIDCIFPSHPILLVRNAAM